MRTFLLLLLLGWGSAPAEIRLPKLVADGMVLQRDIPVKIWGWASEGEKITVQFLGSTSSATAGVNGAWELTLPPLKAGGPYVMRIAGADTVTLNDIMVGDVWVCAGQSNMGLALGWLASAYQDDIDSSDNPSIRQFLVPADANFNGRQKDYKSGMWLKANAKNVRGFTAAGYFFARKLYETYRVPIGLVNASLGGSSTEAWISEESIRSFPKYWEDAQRFKTPGTLERLNKQDDERVGSWQRLLREQDAGLKDPRKTWFDPALNTSAWDTMHVPGYWADSKLGPVNGVVWFRREFAVPASLAGKPALLKLGRIADADSAFINGAFVGTMGSQYAPRFYRIPRGLLRQGENTIVVRVVSFIRHGGFVPGKQYAIVADSQEVNLEGTWKYRLGVAAEPLEDRLFTGKIPTGLFNGMIAPMLPYRIKGALWYQGESNTSRAFEHYDLFKLLIQDWRQNWREDDFPFVYAQLPNFVEVNVETTRYDWALFRESQLKALAIPNTGMAVSIDIGEWNDIHPVNKKDLGSRLALAARKAAYGEEDLVAEGPVCTSAKAEGGKIRLAFRSVGSGLVARGGGDLRYFEICGKDDHFYPAKARIENDNVVVWSDDVRAPVAVRYAWANNPEGANLYNREGLPATPFRTSELY